MDLDKIGKFIKYLRVKKGLSQEELASKINVTNKAISRWECGNGLPGTSLLEPLSKELDIFTYYFNRWYSKENNRNIKHICREDLFQLDALGLAI